MVVEGPRFSVIIAWLVLYFSSIRTTPPVPLFLVVGAVMSEQTVLYVSAV